MRVRPDLGPLPKCQTSKHVRRWQEVHSGRALGPQAASGRSRSRTAALQLRCALASEPTADVLVVGGGVGGLATAGRLAKAGLRVMVLEKNGQVGGRAASVTLGGGYRFDTGPSLLLLPSKYREAFEALGTTLEEHVTIRRVEPAAYRVWYGDNTYLDLLNDHAAMAAQLEAVEPGAGDGFRRFLRMARTSLEMGLPNFIDRDFTSLGDVRGLADLLPHLPGINLLDLLGQHDGRLRQFFRDPRLRAMFTFQDLYVGLSPYTAPAVFSLLAGTELTDGVWYPLGGFGKVVDGLASAATACGATLRTGCEVANILVDPERRAVVGVRLADGSTLAAKAVVCNRDLPAAYELLEGDSSVHAGSPSHNGSSSSSSSASIGDGSTAPAGGSWVADYARQRSEQLGRLKYSNGVISFNFCVTRRLDKLRHHNVFLSDEYREAWVPATTPDQLRRRPNFYVHVPARADPSAAPEGCDSVMVLLPVAPKQQMAGAGYGELVAAGRERVLAAFRDSGVGDISGHIAEELVITPDQWTERYGLRHGAAFGLAHGLDQLSVFRPGTKEGQVEGLYFVGASTRPGNGVPLCLIGSKLAAERVLRDWQAPMRR